MGKFAHFMLYEIPKQCSSQVWFFEALTRLQLVGVIFSSLKNPLKVLLLEDIQYQATVIWYEYKILWSCSVVLYGWSCFSLLKKEMFLCNISMCWIQSLIAWCTSRAFLLCPCLSQLIWRWSCIVNDCETYFFLWRIPAIVNFYLMNALQTMFGPLYCVLLLLALVMYRYKIRTA